MIAMTEPMLQSDNGRTIPDLTGRPFGRAVVLAYAGHGSTGSQWLCLCNCGASFVAAASPLRAGRRKSCGCVANTVKPKPRHGHHGTRTYRIWMAMHSRCRYPSQDGFKNYGGRGVTVCERWAEFPAFLADMGECPNGYSIDRIDNDRGYEPGNCRWASRIEQNLNRRGIVWYEVGGKRLCERDAARALGVAPTTLWKRRANGAPLPAGVRLL